MVYRHGLDLGTARLLHDANLLHPFVVADIYVPHRIPITKDTLIRFTDHSVTQAPKTFDRGAYSTVYKVGYNDGKIRIFKPLAPPGPSGQQPFGWSARQIGIDRRNQRTAERNIATCLLAQALKFDVVAQTQLGLHTLQGAGPGARPQLGLVMELAPGRVGLEGVPPELISPDECLHGEGVPRCQDKPRWFDTTSRAEATRDRIVGFGRASVA